MGTEKRQISQIADDWLDGGTLTVDVDEKGHRTYRLDTIQTALLFDIAKSLRRLLSLANCPNVARGYIGMAKVSRLLDGRTLAGAVLRERARRLRARRRRKVQPNAKGGPR